MKEARLFTITHKFFLKHSLDFKKTFPDYEVIKMKKDSRIYVAGHAGFIGSAVLRKLKKLGYQNLMVRTREEMDLADQEKVNAFFKRERPEYVFLFAACVGGIYANSTYPAEFIFQNLAIQTNVIHTSYRFHIRKLLFPGSACMYPRICPQPMKPKHLLTGPIEPTNEPFAIAKIAGWNMCRSYNRQYGTNFICAVPATVYGPGDHFDQNGHVVAGLIMKFRKAIESHQKEVVIWGTGKPRREFLFIDDAADAFIFLMQRRVSEDLIHIGGCGEASVRSLAQRLKTLTLYKGKIRFDVHRPDGIPRRSLAAGEIRKMGWKALTALEQGLKMTCDWYQQQ